MRRWHVYLIRCGDGTLYTGIATDVERRLAEHRRGRGARYVRGRGPLRLVYQRAVGARGRAQRAEARIKRLPRERKERLLATGDLVERVLGSRIAASSAGTRPGGKRPGGAPRTASRARGRTAR